MQLKNKLILDRVTFDMINSNSLPFFAWGGPVWATYTLTGWFKLTLIATTITTTPATPVLLWVALDRLSLTAHAILWLLPNYGNMFRTCNDTQTSQRGHGDLVVPWIIFMACKGSGWGNFRLIGPYEYFIFPSHPIDIEWLWLLNESITWAKPETNFSLIGRITD